MINKLGSLSVIYFITLFVEMILRAKGFSVIEMFVKPLLMPILVAYLLLSEVKWDKTIWLLCLALLFSWIGDILLLENINIFIGGLGSFLLAHIFYILTFKKPFKSSLIQQKPYLALPFLSLGGSMIFLIKDNLGEMLIPVIVYTSAIIIMGLMALNRWKLVNNSSFWLTFIGACLFVISDSLIALTRFYTPINYDGVWIMLFYGVAQYLILRGIISEKQHNYISN